MANNVVVGDFQTTLDLPVERVLAAAIEADLKDVLIVGHRQDGVLYVAGSNGYGPDNLWLVERARERVMVCVEDR